MTTRRGFVQCLFREPLKLAVARSAPLTMRHDQSVAPAAAAALAVRRLNARVGPDADLRESQLRAASRPLGAEFGDLESRRLTGTSIYTFRYLPHSPLEQAPDHPRLGSSSHFYSGRPAFRSADANPSISCGRVSSIRTKLPIVQPGATSKRRAAAARAASRRPRFT